MFVKIIQKFFSVFLLTGVGQLLAVWFVSVITGMYSDDTVRSIARFDTAFIFALSFCSLGIGQYFPRYLVGDSNFHRAFNDARIIRLIASIFLFFIGIVAFFLGDQEYAFAFLLSPLLYLGGEFALYVRGMQIFAAVCAFIRTSGTYLLLLILILFLTVNEEDIPFLYAFTFFVLSVAASLFSLKMMNKPLAPELQLPEKKVILGVVQLGGVFFLYSSCKILIIPIVDYFYSASELVDAYIFFKIYFLIFSVRRVFVQISHQWLNNKRKTKILNAIFFVSTMAMVFLYLVVEHFFHMDLFKVVLGLNVNNNYLVLLLALSLAVFALYPTRLLMLGGDVYYKKILLSFSCLFIVSALAIGSLFKIELLLYLVVMFEFIVGLASFLYVKKVQQISIYQNGAARV